MRFSQELKELAAAKYNFIFPENQTVSTFVTAFYDAVFLYAYALNDSIQRDRDALYKPINGTELAHLMWNRNFKGITGNVIIDKNGDRISDYSLLDMDPDTGYFHVVANYYNHSGFEFVKGKQIHWAGGRTGPPPDKPECGFDNSLCPCKLVSPHVVYSSHSNWDNLFEQLCLATRYSHLFWAWRWQSWRSFRFSDIAITNWRQKYILCHGRFPGMMCFRATQSISSAAACIRWLNEEVKSYVFIEFRTVWKTNSYFWPKDLVFQDMKCSLLWFHWN